MTAQIAYETYREALHARTRNWHVEKAKPEHQSKSDIEFDQWLRDNQAAMLNRYFMGSFDAMPAHTTSGWEAFAEHAEEGPESAWNNYVKAAVLNFHGDKGLTLPIYTALDPDQREAVHCAVEGVMDYKAQFRPR